MKTLQVDLELVKKYWGNWQRGSYAPDIPVESVQKEERTAHVDWPQPTLPWIAVSFKAPAYSDEQKDKAALDLIGNLGFSPNSELYQRLVIKEQKVDVLAPDFEDHRDPYLVTVIARVKDAKLQAQLIAIAARINKNPATEASPIWWIRGTESGSSGRSASTRPPTTRRDRSTAGQRARAKSKLSTRPVPVNALSTMVSSQRPMPSWPTKLFKVPGPSLGKEFRRGSELSS